MLLYAQSELMVNVVDYILNVKDQSSLMQSLQLLYLETTSSWTSRL